ncbi:MAG: hypothetical protein QM619_08725 [Micropruina sp.]|uniref:hypothetical protein n=1 Tax=Micropruina sp. TaxID=2737536 RepID=UPI0039E3A3FE
MHLGIRLPHWQIWLGSGLTVLGALVLIAQNYDARAWYDFIGPFDFYAYLWQHNSPLPLVLPLVASLPFVLAFSGQLTNRYLTYTRTRANIRVTLGRNLCTNAVTTFVIFLVIGLIPQLFVSFGSVGYDTRGYGLTTPEQVEAARLHSKTFGQLLIYGPWAPALGYSIYLATSAALYATLTLCSVLVAQNRILGLTVPWIIYLLASFLMAVMWLEAYSVALVFPFNLQQIPLANLTFPIGGLLIATAIVVAATLALAPRLPQLQ